jgi:beta-glucosidase
MHCVYPCLSEAEGTSLFTSLAGTGKHTVKIPLSCFDTGALDFTSINTPFLLYTEGTFEAAFANVKWVPGGAKDADATPCSALT